ncbi:MAG: DUF1104 domain-containing protein [Campylobacterota bacterium]|nr:DUF1104 domain-containing protein [Campylobacterota bacterium]
MRLFFIIILFVSTLFAVDYSEMSTQELIAIMGYVKPSNQEKFLKELDSRVYSMTKDQKKKYNNYKISIKKKR